MKNVLLSMLLLLFAGSSYAQIMGGSGSGQPAQKQATNEVDVNGGVSGDVNLFTGLYQTSYALGSVKTPTGLSFTLNMSYQSSFVGGDNTPYISGVPYGDGWNLDIPNITVRYATKAKFNEEQIHQKHVNTTWNNSTGFSFNGLEIQQEGLLEFFAPEIHIPGVASGRLVYKKGVSGKGKTEGISTIATFVLHTFDNQYIEVVYNNNIWIAYLKDGTEYEFTEKKYAINNAVNQRLDENHHNDDKERMRTPTKYISTWYVSRIRNPARHKNYQIIFEYKRFGHFDFYKHTGSMELDAFGLRTRNPDTTRVHQDILLTDIYATYFDALTYEVSQDELLILEKLELRYEEETSQAFKDSAAGMLFTGDPGVEVVDGMYNRTQVYRNGNSIELGYGGDWKRYEHIKKRTDIIYHERIPDPTNPYTWGGNYYRRRVDFDSTDNIYFDHSFIESPLIRPFYPLGNGRLLMPPGDLYSIETEIIADNQDYCNFDINVVSGPGIDDGPFGSGEYPISAGDFNAGRTSTLYSTFQHIAKWNPYYSTRSNMMRTQNFFFMPNLPHTGFYVQVGPGNSDNDFGMSPVDAESYGYTSRRRYMSTYFNQEPTLNPVHREWHDYRRYAQLPSNFGIGWPWHHDISLLEKYDDFITEVSPASSLYFLMSKWWRNDSPSLNTPTATAGASLQKVEMYRYSKKPLLLKKVNHYMLFGEGEDLALQLYMDNAVAFEYGVMKLNLYPNKVASSAGDLTRDGAIGQRIAIVLKRIVQQHDSTGKNPVIAFDYTVPAVSERKIQFANGQFMYTNNSTGLLLNKVVNMLGQETLISYEATSGGNNTEITLSGNPYRYIGDYRYWKGNVTNPFNTYTAMGPSRTTLNLYTVTSIKVQVDSNRYLKRTFTYSGKTPIRASGNIMNPLYSYANNSSKHATVKHNNNDVIRNQWGFRQTEVAVKDEVAGVDVTANTESTKYYHNVAHELFFGRLEKAEVIKSGTIYRKTTYQYDTTLAFRNRYEIGQQMKWGWWCDYCPEQDSIYDTSVPELPNISLSSRADRPVNFLERHADSIHSNYPGYAWSYFVKLVKTTDTIYDADGVRFTINVNENEYYEADYTGKTKTRGFKYILEDNTPVGSGFNLQYEPSWEPAATVSYSPQRPGIKKRTEYFYYYDQIQRHNILNYLYLYLKQNRKDHYHRYNILKHWRLPNFAGNGLEAMAYSHVHGIRNIPSEIREIVTHNDSIRHKHSRYFLYQMDTMATDYTMTKPFFQTSIEVEGPADTSGKGGCPKMPGSVAAMVNRHHGSRIGSTICDNGGDISYNTGFGWEVNDGYNRSDRALIQENTTRSEMARILPLAFTDANPFTTTRTYLNNLSSTLVGPLRTYLVGEHPVDLSDAVIPGSPNLNSMPYRLASSCVIRFLFKLADMLPPDAGAAELSAFLLTADADSVKELMLEPYYSIVNPKPNEPDPYKYNVPYDSLGTGNPGAGKEYVNYYLRLKEEVIQIDETMKSGEFAAFDENTFPPVLKFRFFLQTDYVGGHRLQECRFDPVFPYDTLVVRKVLSLDVFGNIAKEQDQAATITEHELPLYELVIKRLPGTYKIYDARYLATNLGMPQRIRSYNGTLTASDNRYMYYPHNLIRYQVDRYGDTLGFEYDHFGRLQTSWRNGEILDSSYYSVWHTQNLYRPGGAGGKSLAQTFNQKRAYNFTHQVKINNYDTAQKITQTGVHTRNYLTPAGRTAQQIMIEQTGFTGGNPVYEDTAWFSGLQRFDHKGNVTWQQKQFYKQVSSFNWAMQHDPAPTPHKEEYLYENNPFGRLLRRSDFGITSGYPHNSHSAYVMKTGTEVATELSLTNYEKLLLMPGTLANYRIMVTTGIDQDSNKVHTYTDALGRTIASSAVLGAGRVTTLYVYDPAGRLVKTINPIKQTTEYKYNILGLLYQDSSADRGITRYMYDRRGNIVLQQDDRGRGNSPYYQATRYDKLGRVIEQYRINADFTPLGLGMSTYNPDLAPLGYTDLNTSGLIFYNEIFTSNKTYDWKYKVERQGSGATTLYLEDLLADTSTRIREKAFYYDTYPANGVIYYHSRFASNLDTAAAALLTGGRLTVSVSYNESGTPVFYRMLSYFKQGWVNKEIQQFRSAGLDNANRGRLFRIDYPDYTKRGQNLTRNIYLQMTNGVTFTGETTDLFPIRQQHYVYDAFDRPVRKYFSKIATGTLNLKASGSLLHEYLYDPQTQLLRALVNYSTNGGCAVKVDSIVYTRNDPRDRLTKIQSNYFTQELGYDADDLNLDAHSPNNGLNYNGNINYSISEFNINGFNHFTLPGKSTFDFKPGTGAFAGKLEYGYFYDDLNRLTSADATMRSFLITNPANNASKAYGDETYTYDAAGRFTDLDRNLSSTSYPTAPNPAMQRWDYKYYTGTNKLQYIDNNGTSTHLRTCTYDATGNLTADNARGITSGNYNSNHRPWGWSVSGAAYSYLYDEAGRRIYKENTSSGTPKDFYLYDHAGDLVAMANIQTTRITQYELGDLSVRPVNTNQDNYAFRVKDHLGNTRFIYRPLVCTSCTTGCTILTLDAEHMVDYFPYGKVLRENVQGSLRDRFPTTGNERDTETGLDDRNARHSDPDLGIFLGVDPLDEKFPGWSPYNFAASNPVRFVDPNGMAPEDVIIGKALTDNFLTNQAFNAFARTKEGIAFLTNYAKKGDVIAGHTYAADGKYHLEGIDLIFDAQNMTAGNRGFTEESINGGRANIKIVINSNLEVKSQDGNTYDLNMVGLPLYSFPSLANRIDLTARGILSRTTTIFHEAFMHGAMTTKDFLDDRLFNYSHIDHNIKSAYPGFEKHWDHIQAQVGSDAHSILFNTQGLKGLSSANSMFQSGSLYNRDQLKDMMWNFNGSWK